MLSWQVLQAEDITLLTAGFWLLIMAFWQHVQTNSSTSGSIGNGNGASCNK